MAKIIILELTTSWSINNAASTPTFGSHCAIEMASSKVSVQLIAGFFSNHGRGPTVRWSERRIADGRRPGLPTVASASG